MINTDPPDPPMRLSQDVSASTETSAVVQWESPILTGGSGVSITGYTVTVDGQMFQTVSHDGREIFTTNITELDYNKRYNVAITTSNSCGFSSSPTNTSVFIEARGKCSMFHRNN